MKKFLTFVFAILISAGLYAGKGYEVEFQKINSNTMELSFEIGDYQLEEITIDGKIYTRIVYDGSITTEKKGFAELNYVHASVMLSPNKNFNIEVSEGEYIDISLEHPLLPSRGVIYRDQDPNSIPYTIDPASIVDKWYPENTVETTDPYILKDIRGTNVFVYPFKYNALTQTLRYIKDVKVTIKETAGDQILNPMSNVTDNILYEMDALYNSVFINYENSRDDLTIGDYGDLLIICTDRDSDAIDPLIEWKKERGLDVFKEIVPAGTNAKDLIQEKYDENNDILYVLLVGDWDDIKSDVLQNYYPMDPQLGCVVGTDDLADIAIGRFSAESPADVEVQVNKVINYEKLPEAGAAWYKQAIGIASNQGPGDDDELDYEHNDVIFENKLETYTYNYFTPIYDPSANSTMVKNAVEEGASVINYTGHGSKTSWGSSGFSNSNVAQLTNESMLPIIISVACNNGEFNAGECFSEAWLKKEGGGAIMMLGATISQPWDPPMRGQDYFMDVMTGGYDYDQYPGQNGINTNELRNTVGSFIFNGLTLMIMESSGSSDQETAKTWTMFGDPSLQMRTDTPSEISLSNDVILMGVPFSTIITKDGTPVEGAVVTLSDGENYYTAMTDATGSVSVENALEPGICKLVVTGYNLVPVYMDATVIPPDGPYIVMNGCIIGDETGNGNGEADFGEDIQLDYILKNVGIETATDVVVYLSSEDENVTLNTTEFTYGDIAADEVMSGSDFSVTVSDAIPDMHIVTFDLQIMDGEGSIWETQSHMPANAPVLDLELDQIVDDEGDNNGRLDPGETADIYINALNLGHASSPDATLTVSTDNVDITLNSSTFDYGSIDAGGTASGMFNISISEYAVIGSIAQFDLHIVAGNYEAYSTITLNIGLIMEDWETADFTNYFWEHGGNSYWEVSEENPYEGAYCVKSGDINDSQTSELSITVEVLSDDEISFFKRVSSEANYDYLEFYIDDEKVGSWAGNVPWSEEVFEVTAGTHTFKWVYMKDYYVSSGLDCAWVDYILLPPIVTPVSVEQTVRDINNIVVYPNPCKDMVALQIQSEFATDASILVFNGMGQVVYNTTTDVQSGIQSVSLPVNDLNDGIYFYQVEMNGEKYTGKFLKAE